MLKSILHLIFSVIIIVLIFSVDSAFAITVTPLTGVNLPDLGNNPGITISNIIQYFLLLTGILAVMAITWGGIKFILSTGDDEKMKKARYTVIYAFVGIIVAGLAYSIVEVLTKIDLS